jgi:antitoxin HicB
MLTLAYPVELASDGDAVMATFPDFDAVTYGAAREEALAHAADLLETVVSHRLAEGLDLPRPSPAKGRPVVNLPALSAAKALLNLELRAAGIAKAELARRLGWHMPQVMRVLDLRHKSSLEAIEAALRALGKTIVVGVKDAA